MSYKFIEIRFNKKTRFDNIYKNIIKFFFLILIILLFSLFNNKQLIHKFRDNLFQNMIKFYTKIVDVNDLRKINKKGNWVLQYDTCSNDKENFSYYIGVNCIVNNSKESLDYIIGNSYGDHLVPVIFDLNNGHSLYKARFEDCYVDNKNCNDLSNIILKKYKNISKPFKTNYLFISLSSQNLSYKKIDSLLNRLPENVTVVYVYPHPVSTILSNIESLNNYKLKKEENFIILNNFKNKFNFLIFDPYAFLCPNDSCKSENYENFFTDGSHFTLRISKSLSPFLKNFLNNN